MPEPLEGSDQDNSGKSWNEYRRLILRELDRLDANDTKLADKVADIERELLIVKTKAALWGAVAGLVLGSIVSGLVATWFK